MANEERYKIGVDVAEGLDRSVEFTPEPETTVTEDAVETDHTESPADERTDSVRIGEVFFLHDEARYETRTTVRKVTIPLSDEEKIELGTAISGIQGRIDHIESLKKQIAGLREEMSVLSNKYRNGVDVEQLQCTVYYDYPAVGQKTIVRDDTREIVEIGDMNDEEMQGNLPFVDVEAGVTTTISDGDGNVVASNDPNIYTIPENRDPAEDADAEMEEGYAVAAVERED